MCLVTTEYYGAMFDEPQRQERKVQEDDCFHLRSNNFTTTDGPSNTSKAINTKDHLIPIILKGAI